MDPNTDQNIEQLEEKQQILKESQFLGEEQGLSKYLYPRFTKEEVEKSQDFSFFRTILFLGQTGAGKTSSINFFINTFLGVQFEDNFRFLLINEKTISETQAVSQTQDVSIYYVKPSNGNPALRIIDTPGLGDTRGLEQDQINLKKISESLITKLEDQLSLLICFIVKASNNRLTVEQNYHNTKILQLFQKQQILNFSFLITHYDGSGVLPEAIEALQYQGDGNNINLISIYIKAGAILNPWYYIVNNKPLFCKKGQKNNTLLQEYWEFTMDNYQKLIDNRIKVPRVSDITITKQLCVCQSKLQALFLSAKQNFAKSIQLMSELQKLYTDMPLLKDKVAATSNIMVSRIETVEEKQYFQDQRVLYCTDCDRVCSLRLVSDVSTLFKKANYRLKCKSCNCSSDYHEQRNFIVNLVDKTRYEVSEDLKKKHIESLKAYKENEFMQEAYEGGFLLSMYNFLAQIQQIFPLIGAIQELSIAPSLCKVEFQHLKDYLEQKKSVELQALLQSYELIPDVSQRKGKYAELNNFLQNSIKTEKKQILIDKFKNYL